MKKKLNCILLVDDDDDCNFFHQRLLLKMNCTEQIQIAHDGKEAMEFLNSEVNEKNPTPALIFLDINMPCMNGWEFIEEYERLDESLKAKIVIMMLTSSLNPDDMERALRFPLVNGFKNKYLTKETLTNVLAEHFPEYFYE